MVHCISRHTTQNCNYATSCQSNYLLPAFSNQADEFRHHVNLVHLLFSINEYLPTKRKSLAQSKLSIIFVE